MGETVKPKPVPAVSSRLTRNDDDHLDALESAFETLSLWRTLSAHQFTVSDVLSMREAVARIVPFGVEKWTAGRDDVAAAIGAAAAFLPLEKLTVPFELCMTALAVHAMEGDAAAAVVLTNVLRNLPGYSRAHRRIATSWLVANLASTAARARDKSKLPSGRPAPARKSDRRS
jgi:hypothetical protein